MPMPTTEAAPSPASDSLQLLLDTVGALSLARGLDEVQKIVRRTARRLVSADGATFVLRDLDQCFYADEDAISPLWKGQRFPLEACISGWSMLNRSAVVIEDIYRDERIPQDAYQPTFVKSLVMVPIRTADPLGAIGMYWATPHAATDEEVRLAQALADSTAVALAHVRVLAELAQTVQMSETDALTAVPNRRAWDRALGLSLAPGRRVVMGLIDLDHFKAFNDTHGHQAGDRQLRQAADAWGSALRSQDLVARYGGEEFAILLPDCTLDDACQIAERLRLATPAGTTASIGLAEWDGSEAPTRLIARADAALYEAKRSGRDRVLAAA